MFVTFILNHPAANQYVSIDPRCVASVQDTSSGAMIRYHNGLIFHVDASVQEVTAKLNDRLGCKVDTELATEKQPWSSRIVKSFEKAMQQFADDLEHKVNQQDTPRSHEEIERFLEQARQEPHYVFVNPAKVAEIIDRLRKLTTETEPKPSYERCMKILQDLNQLCEMLYV